MKAMRPFMSRLSALRDFLLIWCGQLISEIGFRLSNFALSVWVLRKSGSTTQIRTDAFCHGDSCHADLTVGRTGGGSRGPSQDHEPPRDSRRLHFLRGLEHGKTESIFT